MKSKKAILFPEDEGYDEVPGKIIKPILFKGDPGYELVDERNWESNQIVESIRHEGEEKMNIGESMQHSAEPIKPISFFANLLSEESREMEQIQVDSSELGGLFVMSRKTLEKLSMPFLEQCEKSRNQKCSDMRNLATQIVSVTKNMTGDNTKRIGYQLANFNLKPLYKLSYKDRSGNVIKEKEKICLRLTVYGEDGNTTEEFGILSSSVDDIVEQVKRRCSYAVLYEKSYKNEVVNQFRKATKNLSTRICYEFAGWVKHDGKYHFLHKGCQLTNTDVVTKLDLPCDPEISEKGLISIFNKSMNLYYDQGVVTTLVLYSYLGILYKVFDEAGYAPHFMLFIHGMTGSFKTSLSKVLYVQLENNENREKVRRIDLDTMTSIEAALAENGADTVTLFDDFSPSKTPQQKNERLNKLEHLIRIVGDGSSKSRSNVNLEDVRGTSVKGMVALTGELQGKGESSALRCLFCKIEKEQVNLSELSWFQKNPRAYTTLLYHFTCFVSGEWESILLMIRKCFEPYRRKVEREIKARRLVDVTVTLWIVAEIIGLFQANYCGNERYASGNLVGVLQGEILSVVQASEAVSTEESPTKMFMITLKDLIDRGAVTIGHPGDLVDEHPTSYDGFVEMGYVYLLPDIAYKKVTAQMKARGLYMPLEEGTIFKMLCEEHIAEWSANGSGKRLYYFRRVMGNGERIRYVKIKVDKFEQLDD